MKLTAITNARVFDGEQVIGAHTVVLDGARIGAVGGPVPPDATVTDASGGTLLPGLIDSHVHTDLDGLRLALRFGVTTELEMMGHWTPEERAAKLPAMTSRTCGRPGWGSPRQAATRVSTARGRCFPGDGDYAHDGPPPGYAFPFCATPAEAAKMIEQQVAEGYDYVKIMIEDGTVVGHPGLPVISDDVLAAAVREAHRHGKLAIAHATTRDGARRAVRAGIDGLGHLFADGPATPGIVADIAGAGTFVIPTLTVLSSATGHAGAGSPPTSG